MAATTDEQKREALMRMREIQPQAGPSEAQKQQQQGVQLRDMRPQLRETVSREQVQAETVARRTWDMFLNAIG